MPRTSRDIQSELLVLEAQAGDAPAFDTLAQLWSERLFRYAHRRTGNPDGAWDVVQESWVAIVKGIRRLDDPALFGPWSRRIVANKSADWIKKRQADRRTASLDHDAPAPQIVKNESVLLVRRALRDMPPDRREILSMHYSDGLRIEAIAQALGIPAGTVKSRLFHARNELKQLIERSRS